MIISLTVLMPLIFTLLRQMNCWQNCHQNCIIHYHYKICLLNIIKKKSQCLFSPVRYNSISSGIIMHNAFPVYSVFKYCVSIGTI